MRAKSRLKITKRYYKLFSRKYSVLPENEYWYKSALRSTLVLAGLVIASCLTGTALGTVKLNEPIMVTAYSVNTVQKEVEVKPDTIDQYIADAVDEFLPEYESESKMIMHCLAHRESGHGASNKCGDSGKACGPFQFWEETWVRMRKQMISQGVADEIGDRYDLKEATRTTAWAISQKHALEWGPVSRASKGSDYATCQVPSFY